MKTSSEWSSISRLVLLMSVVAAFIFCLLSPWLLSEYWLFLPCLGLAGFAMVLVQRENVAYRHLGKLLLGCTVFGALAMALVTTRMRLTPPFSGPSPWTFSYLVESDNLMMAAVIASVGFLGGLVGIVLKGFYVLCVSGRPKRRRALIIGSSVLFAVLAVGVAIPKLTVHDLVSVEPSLKNCVSMAVSAHYDNPLERLALLLGRSQIVSATRSSTEVKNYTLFRIPLGALRGDWGLREGIECNMIGDGSVPQTLDNATSTAMSVEDEHSGPVEYCTTATRPCEVSPKGLNVTVHVPQGLTLREENQASWDTGLFMHLTLHDSTNGPNTIDSYATSPDFALGVGEGMSPYSGPALDLNKPLEKTVADLPWPNIRNPRTIEMDGRKGLVFYWLGDIYGGDRTFEAVLIIPNLGHEYSNIVFPIGLERTPSETATFDVGDMDKIIASYQGELSRKLEEIDRDFDIE